MVTLILVVTLGLAVLVGARFAGTILGYIAIALARRFGILSPVKLPDPHRDAGV